MRNLQSNIFKVFNMIVKTTYILLSKQQSWMIINVTDHPWLIYWFHCHFRYWSWNTVDSAYNGHLGTGKNRPLYKKNIIDPEWAIRSLHHLINWESHTHSNQFIHVQNIFSSIITIYFKLREFWGQNMKLQYLKKSCIRLCLP